jgi:Lsr2
MAQRTQVVFTDDVDGSEAIGTVKFGLEGTAYEVDLSQKNADKLTKVLAPYIAAARKTANSPARRAAKSTRPAGPRPQEVRAWAKDQGIEVKDKGRVPAELIVKFQAAQ